MSSRRFDGAKGSGEAAYWYLRHESDVELSPQEWRQWENWCANPDHGDQYDQVVWLRSKMKSLPRPLPVTDEQVRADCASDGIPVHSSSRRLSPRDAGHRASAWALALAIAFAVVGIFLWHALPLPSSRVRLAVPETLAYSAERLQQLRASGRPVLVNLRAGWCPTCVVNERNALSQNAVRQLMATKHIVYLKGEWTADNVGVNVMLKQFGRKGVPLYLLYCPQVREPEILPEVLTADVMVRTLSRLPD